MVTLTVRRSGLNRASCRAKDGAQIREVGMFNDWLCGWLIRKYCLDIQYKGEWSSIGKKWRAFQNLSAPAASDGDLYDGYGDTPAAAVKDVVARIRAA